MQHGLAVGMWMCMGAMLATWAWISGTWRQVMRVPASWAAGALLLTAVLVKSVGALALLCAGLGALWAARALRMRTGLVLLALVPVLYMGVRMAGVWHGEGVIEAARLVSDSHAGSFRFRIENEEVLLDKALQRPLLGWGGWGRSRVYDEQGADATVTDGLWVITLGQHGLVGLLGMMGTLLVPAVLVIVRLPKGWEGNGYLCASAGVAVMLVLYSIDCLLNAMVNPVFALAAGGTANVAAMLKGRGRKALGGGGHR